MRATEPNCHLCGYPIDLSLDTQRDPMGSTVDELTPLAHDGDALDLANCHHAHRWCNTARGTRPVTPELREELRSRIGHKAGTPSRAW